MRSAAERGSVHARLPGCCGHAGRPMIDACKLLRRIPPSLLLAFPTLHLPPRHPPSSFARPLVSSTSTASPANPISARDNGFFLSFCPLLLIFSSHIISPPRTTQRTDHLQHANSAATRLGCSLCATVNRQCRTELESRAVVNTNPEARQQSKAPIEQRTATHKMPDRTSVREKRLLVAELHHGP